MYPPMILLVGFLDRPMYMMSVGAFPVREVSITAKTTLLSRGRFANEIVFSGHGSEKPISFRVKEFMDSSFLGRDLTVPKHFI